MKEKIRRIEGLTYAIAGLLLGILPKALVCAGGQIETMPCCKSAEAEVIAAVGFILVGVVITLVDSKKVTNVMLGFGAAFSVIGILIPAKIIGGCMDPTMPCRTVAFPMIYSVCGIILALIMVHFIVSAVMNLEQGKCYSNSEL